MVPTLEMKIEKMAVFSLQKGEKWGKGAKKSLFQEENGHFSNFHFEGGYQCRQKIAQISHNTFLIELTMLTKAKNVP